ncbi:MAG: hypothetical protein ACE5Q3_18115 [Alphaproteobacteria bacterium]
MTEPLERDEIIGLLKRLGSDRDEEVLEAAREAHARITAADMTWEDLLLPTEAAGDTDDAGDPDDAGDTGYQDLEDEHAEPPPEKAEKNAESLALIDKLLARSGTSENLREELENYKADIAEGEFEERDRRYIRALHQRLSKRR